MDRSMGLQNPQNPEDCHTSDFDLVSQFQLKIFTDKEIAPLDDNRFIKFDRRFKLEMHVISDVLHEGNERRRPFQNVLVWDLLNNSRS